MRKLRGIVPEDDLSHECFSIFILHTTIRDEDIIKRNTSRNVIDSWRIGFRCLDNFGNYAEQWSSNISRRTPGQHR